jgi:hypothetical protein
VDGEDSIFEITIELSFENGEFCFNELSSRVYDLVEVLSHFLTSFSPDAHIIPRSDRDN